MKKDSKHTNETTASEPASPSIKTFSSQEEAERYTMIQNLEMTDMEKFRMFCRMMRIGKMLSSAKIVK